jgi:cytochrome c553
MLFRLWAASNGRMRACLTIGFLGVMLFPCLGAAQTPLATFTDASRSTVRLEVDGKKYLVDVAAGTVRPEEGGGPGSQPGAVLFAQNCSRCHGPDGRGGRESHAPNLTQVHLSDQQIGDTIRHGKSGQMPAFGDQLNDQQVSALATYVHSLEASSSSGGNQVASDQPGVYQPGDDSLFILPTGRAVDKHAVIVNFTHRFAFDSAVTGPARGAQLFGLDNFALSSFGVRYGVTDRLSVDVWRSPSFIGRPIQLMAAYNILDEHHEQPFNLAFRASIEGQDNFRKNFTENLEAIFSRSLTSRAQIYVIPTASFNDRPVLLGSLDSSGILDVPGVNAFSIGVGLSVDIRPTVALIAEVIPTVVNGTELGIHRPPFSFAIQKKIYRHAFTFGFTTSPGTTVSQRAGTSATFLNDPSADTPAGLFLGFDLTRRIY